MKSITYDETRWQLVRKPPAPLNSNGIALDVQSGFVYVLHADQTNWTSAARLTEMTHTMVRSYPPAEPPSAQVDERVEFEKESKRRNPGVILTRDANGDYYIPTTKAAWAAWQARLPRATSSCQGILYSSTNSRDSPMSKKAIAIASGALEVSSKEIVRVAKALRISMIPAEAPVLESVEYQ